MPQPVELLGRVPDNTSGVTHTAPLRVNALGSLSASGTGGLNGIEATPSTVYNPPLRGFIITTAGTLIVVGADGASVTFPTSMATGVIHAFEIRQVTGGTAAGVIGIK
jgi:hypothetical protein